MLNIFELLRSKKAEFFILTAVMIVGIFYAMSQFVNPYSFIDTSVAVRGNEPYFFENVKENAVKTIELSKTYDELNWNLKKYERSVERIAADKGYILLFDYDVSPFVEEEGYIVLINLRIVLISQNMRMESSFPVQWIFSP